MPFRYLVLAIAIAASGAGALGQPAQPVSLLEREAALPLDAVDRLALPSVDNEALLDRDEARLSFGEPEALQFAEPFDLEIAPGTRGSWEEIAGYSVWRLVVGSPGAYSINAGFSRFNLPEGAALWLYPAGGEPTFRAFTARDHQPSGELWTPIVPGDEVVIELNLPGSPPPAFEFEIARLSHAYRPFGIPGEDITVGRSASCHVDVICPEGDDYRQLIRSVATYSRGGSRVCSGAAINNARFDGTPLFLTAAHCGLTVSNAPSVVVYWNFENSYCRPPGTPEAGGPGDGSLAQFNSGAMMRGAGSSSDWALIELTQEIDPTYEVFLAGWDRRDQATTSGVAIHHPRTQEKRISFDFSPTTITNYGSHTPNPSGTHLRVAAWDMGTVQHGSSGSPFFGPEQRIVGQLHGGYAGGCAFQPVYYGRVFTSMQHGLAQWLDPDATGVEFVEGVESGVSFPELPEVSASSTMAMRFTGETVLTAGPSPFLPRDEEVSLTVWASIDGPGVIAELSDDDHVAFRVEAVDIDGQHVLRYMHHAEGGSEVARDFPQVDIADGLRHITVTRGEEPAAVRVFVDGQRVGQPFFYQQPPPYSTQRVFYVGNSASGEAGVTGLFDEVRLYRTRVPIDAVRPVTHASYALGDAPESLVAYYRFEADTTGFAFDFSNSGSSALLSGDQRVASPFPVGEQGFLMHSAASMSGTVGPEGLRMVANATTPLGSGNALGLYVKHLSDEVIDDEDLPDGIHFRSETVWGAHLYGEVTADLWIDFQELGREDFGPRLLHRDTPTSAWADVTEAWNLGEGGFFLAGATDFGEWAVGFAQLIASEGGATDAGAYRFDAPFPNPISRTASFDLTVREGQYVRLELFDMVGRRVAVLLDAPMTAGAAQTVVIDAADLPSGMYVVRAAGETFSASRKVMVVR